MMEANGSANASWPWMVWTPAYWFGALQPAHASSVVHVRETAPAIPDAPPSSPTIDGGNVIKAWTRANAELLSLASRRSQAWIALPSQLAQCRNPLDLVAAHAQFWHAASQHHVDAARRLSSAWAGAWPGHIAQPSRMTPSATTKRDQLVLPDVREQDVPAAATVSPPPPSQGARQVAERRTAA